MLIGATAPTAHHTHITFKLCQGTNFLLLLPLIASLSSVAKVALIMMSVLWDKCADTDSSKHPLSTKHKPTYTEGLAIFALDKLKRNGYDSASKLKILNATMIKQILKTQ